MTSTEINLENIEYAELAGTPAARGGLRPPFATTKENVPAKPKSFATVKLIIPEGKHATAKTGLQTARTSEG